MADVIYKYELPNPVLAGPGEFPLRLPVGAELLDVQLQPNYPGPGATAMLWARVNNDADVETRLAMWLATGEPIHFRDQLVYAGTLQFQEFVFHLYVRPSEAVRRG